MTTQFPLPESAKVTERRSHDGTCEISRDIAFLRLGMVNVVLWGVPEAGDRNWVLVDTGILAMASKIARAAERRFGKDARPAAIILTHAHFDHAGSLKELLGRWEVPVFAHAFEMPYLNGTSLYPFPARTEGGGSMPLLTPLFPRVPVDVSDRLEVLPVDGSVPGMPGWRWLHTPGHTPGHISLWRPQDRTLIAGDAIITTSQALAYGVATQAAEMHGPPRYFTPDWELAGHTVKALASLEPELVITGHGRAMSGPKMRSALHALACHFRETAAP